MATPSINGTAVPASMATRGRYRFDRQRMGAVNGNGVAIAAGPQNATWVFSSMTPTEYAWWYTTILAGSLSATLTAAELWDDLMAEQTFTSGVLYRPVYELHNAGFYWNVTIEIKHLIPILLT